MTTTSVPSFLPDGLGLVAAADVILPAVTPEVELLLPTPAMLDGAQRCEKGSTSQVSLRSL